MFALAQILPTFKECADGIGEQQKRKSLRGSTTFRSRNSRICPSATTLRLARTVLAIRFNPETRERTLDQLRWGLIPHWAKNQKIAYRTINARAETVDKAPSYRQAFIKRRCLIPADGFYEWRKTAKPKLPFAIAMKDDRPFPLRASGKTGKIPNLQSGYAPARLLQASLMHSSHKSILVCR